MSGYIGFCIKACAGGALALVLAVMPANGPAPARTAQPAPSLYTPAQAASLTATARALAPYLTHQANGTLTLNAPASVISGLPAVDVQAISTGLSSLNVQISSGRLLTTPAGAVFNPSTEGFKFQGGWSGMGTDWWHDYLCLNHNDVTTMYNSGWWTISNAGIAAIAKFATVIGLAIAIVANLYRGWMKVADKGNGSCLNFGHWPPPNIWVTGQ